MNEKKGFFTRAFADMKENAKKQHELDKENFKAIKADSRRRLEEAKKVDPDFQEFKDAKGIKAKARVVVSHMERDGKQQAEKNLEKNRQRLAEQRAKMNQAIDKNKGY